LPAANPSSSHSPCHPCRVPTRKTATASYTDMPLISCRKDSSVTQHNSYITVLLVVFGRPFVKRFSYGIRPLSVCLSCLSVTLVYCGQTVRWIKMELGMHAVLGSGHIVLDGSPAPPRQKGAELPIFGPCLLWPNGWMDEDAIWYGSIPQPRPHGVRRGPSSTRERSTAAPPPLFGLCLLWSRSPISATAELLLCVRWTRRSFQ